MLTGVEYDLVSVGGGFAGMIAANRAAQLGLRAAVIERGAEELYLCNSRYSGGVMHVSYRDPSNPSDDLLRAINEITDGHANPALAQAIVEHCKRGLEWLQAEGARFARLDPSMQRSDIGSRAWILAPVRPPVTHLEWKGRGADVTLRMLEQNLVRRGGVVHRATSALSLLMEQGTCRGVRVSRGGEEFDVRASAVVLADGGFQGNREMVLRHLTPKPDALKQRGAGTGVGDGLRMAREVGADITALDCFYGHVLSRDAMTNERAWPYPQLDLLAAAGLLLDRRGSRIADEGLGGVFLANAIARQADPLGTFVVFDEVIWQDSGRAAAVPPNPTLLAVGGTLHQADTLAELAAKLGMDAAGLEGTVADYNRAVAAGTIGSLSPVRTNKRRKAQAVAVAPFYGAPACAGLTNTMGGVRIDGHARVLKTDGTPIQGLFAAGTTTGGLEGGPAVGYVSGLMKAMVFGLLAAERVAGHG
jgi:fumarate reductase flavoprotein subunit